MSKLNQIIAIEKGVKARSKQSISALYIAVKKPTLFSGFTKHWEKSDDDGEDRPRENKRVQLRVSEVLENASESLTELFDVTAQKDFANCNAKADVVVDGTVIIAGVPATHLLFLEKQLADMKTFISVLPTLSADEEWGEDKALGLFKTDAVRTRSTAKVQEAITLAPPTPEHPAQTQLITKDVVVGHWNTVKQSGAAVESEKKRLYRRVEALIKAVKFAREEANMVEAPKQNIGASVFNYLLG